MRPSHRLLSAVVLSTLVAACGGGNSSSDEQRPTVGGYLTDLDNLAKEGPSSLIPAGETVALAIFGRNFNSQLSIDLGGKACASEADEPYNEEERDSPDAIVRIECPAQAIGSPVLRVFDDGRLIFSEALVAIDATALAKQRAEHLARLRPVFDETPESSASRASTSRTTNAAGATPRNVFGRVTADRPENDTKTGALIYSAGKIINFPVRGVVVQLINPSDDAAVRTVATDADGKYFFSNVEQGHEYIVRVKAQLAKTRRDGVVTGPQYNFMVRDNASGKFGDAKPLYTLEKRVASTEDEVNLNAPLGFGEQGQLLDPDKRKSAPFAILDVVYNAVSGIEATNANIQLRDLHIYWSANNTNVDAELTPEQKRTLSEKEQAIELLRQKMNGKIDTSHFQAANDYPGLFLLGHADVDTDEFDRGVVGHEFGHYLQYAASYDASPGGSHGNSPVEFKDPSLSYSEGFGTAIGGLLAKSQYYTDSKGTGQQAVGPGFSFALDLKKQPTAGNGFYSESSVAYLLYKLGTNDSYGGFGAFWRGLTAMAQGYESSTVFTFLDRYSNASKATRAQLLQEAKEVNIRTVDTLGILPSTDTGDPKIDQAASGADDLEKIYLALSPNAPTDSKELQNLTPTAPTFCVNSRLAGAQHDNGLGVSRRFHFKAPFSGVLTYQLTDKDGKEISIDQFSMKLRDGATGKRLSNGPDRQRERWVVTSGATYSLTITFDADQRKSLKSAGGENFCGNQLTLWNFVE